MAVVDSPLHALQKNARSGEYVPQWRAKGRLYYAQTEWSSLSIAQGDSVRLFNIPQGSVIRLVSIQTPGMGSGVRMTLGPWSDRDKYLTLGVGSAIASIHPVFNAEYVLKYDDQTIYATFLDANPSDNVKMAIGMAFVLGG